ncbi:MAG: LytTR family DNA-binding domain-containing protein [Erythrobacter sp.]
MTRKLSQTAILNALFLFGLPAMIGLILGGNQLRAGSFLPWGLSVLYWLALVLLTWLLFAGATRATGRILVPWDTPPWVAWIVGAVFGSLLARPLIYIVADTFEPFMYRADLRTMRPVEFSIDFLFYYLANWLAIIVLWVGACALREWLQNHLRWDQEQFGLASDCDDEVDNEAAAAAAENLAAFMRKLPNRIGREVIAMQSEDHYVRVHTTGGNALVLSTISDAASELQRGGVAGQRVHRSWWVAQDAVKGARQDGRKFFLKLRSGLEVPVSQTYREVVRLTGLAPDTGDMQPVAE